MSKASQRLGAAVKARRAELGLSQRALAKKAAIDYTSIQQIERGDRQRLHATTKTKLEDALEVQRGDIDRNWEHGDALTPRPAVQPEAPAARVQQRPDIYSMSLDELAEVAAWVAQADKSPTAADRRMAGERWLRNALDKREQRLRQQHAEGVMRTGQHPDRDAG